MGLASRSCCSTLLVPVSCSLVLTMVRYWRMYLVASVFPTATSDHNTQRAKILKSAPEPDSPLQLEWLLQFIVETVPDDDRLICCGCGEGWKGLLCNGIYMWWLWGLFYRACSRVSLCNFSRIDVHFLARINTQKHSTHLCLYNGWLLYEFHRLEIT